MEDDILKAYAEVNKILSLMEKKYVEKIPHKMREMFKNEKLDGYEPSINIEKTLDKQNLQRKTLAILAMLNLNYWCETEKERQELLKVYAENDEKEEQAIRERYNPDNLFKNKEKIKQKNIVNNTHLIEYKEEKLIRRILKKIKSLFIRQK